MDRQRKGGVFYGIGVGPGDPELLTLKAVGLLRQAEVVAAADTGGPSLALRIAAEHIRDKELLLCPAPMTRDPHRLQAAWEEGTERICAQLDKGRTVAFVTLGDPTIYSTCGYLFQRIRERGFSAQLVPGVTSFCAAAAAAGVSLCEGEESLLVLPASSPLLEESRKLPVNRVVMKAGRSLERVRDSLGERAVLVENCGMEEERIIPLSEAESAGYFATVLQGDPSALK